MANARIAHALLGALFLFIPGAGRAAPPQPPTSIQVVARTQTAALLTWTPGAGATHGFKIRPSDTPGVHPDPTVYPGGKLAAFTWSSDDGYEDNLKYAPIFESRGLAYSIYVNPSTIGTSDKLTWGELQALHLAGHEIANHTQNHTSLIDDRALTVRFTGAEACSLAITSSRLRTWVDGALDFDFLLTDPDVAFLSTLSAAIDADPDYESSLLFAADTIYATRSQWLDPIAGLHVGAGAEAETLTTMRGVHDDAEMVAEVMDAHQALMIHLLPIDPEYRCRTLAYPNHAHTQWAMSKLNELGYLGARSGPIGDQPFFSEAAFKIGFTSTYEVPHAFPRPSNAWSEATTRSTYLARMVTWKQNREWSVLMAHHEAEVDSLHLEWTIDTIASDPQIWIARFDEVMEYLSQFYVDVGHPVDGSGQVAAAWLNGLPEHEDRYVVITAYNDALQESGWSAEIEIPAFSTGTPAPETAAAIEVPSMRAIPNPFDSATTIEFEARTAGPTHAEVWNLEGRRVRSFDLGTLTAGRQRFAWDGRTDSGERLAAGIFWVRVTSPGGTVSTGKVTLLR